LLISDFESSIVFVFLQILLQTNILTNHFYIMKNTFLFLTIALFAIACSSNQTAEITEQQIMAEMLTPANFSEKVADFVGKEVSVTGVIDHVCSHGGKKMFLADLEGDGRVRVNTGEDMAAFKTEWEGSMVIATGIVNELVIDEAYLIEWEEELKEAAEAGEAEEGHEGCEYEAYTESASYKQITRYREMMAEKGTNKLSFYSMTCTSYQILED
jgi:hypothetical protein